MEKYKLVIPKNLDIIFRDKSIDDITIESKKVTREVFLMKEYNDNLEYYKEIPKSWIKIIEEEKEYFIYDIINFFKKENGNKSIIFRYSDKIILLKKEKKLIQKITKDSSEYLNIEDLEDFLKRKSKEFFSFIIVDSNKDWINKAYKYYIWPKDESETGGSGAGRLTSWLKQFPDVKENECFKILNGNDYLNENFFLCN